METVALAFLFQIWTRHRLGLLVSSLSLVLMVVVFPPLLRRFDSIPVFVALMIPPIHVAVYIMNLLITSDQVGSMSSGYPRRMYTLPVPTRTLVLWPLLISLVTVVLLWLSIAVLIYRRAGYQTPLLLPAVALAVAMTLCQLLSWLPLEGTLVRLASFGSLLLFAAPGLLLIGGQVSQVTLSLLGATGLPALYAVAWYGLSGARRGDRWTFGLDRVVAWFRAAWELVRPARRPFRSSSAAQLWYDERCHGMFMLAMDACVLIPVASMVFLTRTWNVFGFRVGLVMMAFIPFLLAGSQGLSLGRFQSFWVSDPRINPFVACRPISTDVLIRAKYLLAARVVVTTWLMDLALIAGVVLITGRFQDVAAWFREFSGFYPGWKAGAIGGVAALLAPVVHWRMLTDHLVPVLTGSRWISSVSFLCTSALLGGGIILVALGIEHHRFIPHVVSAALWVTAASVLIRAIVTVWSFRAGLRLGLVDSAWIRSLLLLWIVFAAITIALTHWLVLPGFGGVPRPVLLLASVAVLPMARFGLAPMALAWNRHG